MNFYSVQIKVKEKSKIVFIFITIYKNQDSCTNYKYFTSAPIVIIELNNNMSSYCNNKNTN